MTPSLFDSLPPPFKNDLATHFLRKPTKRSLQSREATLPSSQNIISARQPLASLKKRGIPECLTAHPVQSICFLDIHVDPRRQDPLEVAYRKAILGIHASISEEFQVNDQDEEEAGDGIRAALGHPTIAREMWRFAMLEMMPIEANRNDALAIFTCEEENAIIAVFDDRFVIVHACYLDWVESFGSSDTNWWCIRLCADAISLVEERLLKPDAFDFLFGMWEDTIPWKVVHARVPLRRDDLEKAQAFLMCQHPRLGLRSSSRKVSPDIIENFIVQSMVQESITLDEIRQLIVDRGNALRSGMVKPEDELSAMVVLVDKSNLMDNSDLCMPKDMLVDDEDIHFHFIPEFKDWSA